MKFVHEDDDFAELLRIAGAERAIRPALVEKDYWVTHTLWSVQRSGLECSFKGGTSLSKAYGLIERFSEDLDVQLGGGSASGVPKISNWASTGAKHVAARREFFHAVVRVLMVPGAHVGLWPVGDTWRSAELHVVYPSALGEPLPEPMKPFVVIEVGSARVVPAQACDLGSFVHSTLERLGQLEQFVDNRPRAVACVHPVVTLIEKLDAIARRFPRADRSAASFVRHYEDAARVIDALETLPPLGVSVDALLIEMTERREIQGRAHADDAAFAPVDSARWRELRQAHAATAVMFFGPTLGLDAACARIRAWLAAGPSAPRS